jgi:hypothetical protein
MAGEAGRERLISDLRLALGVRMGGLQRGRLYHPHFCTTQARSVTTTSRVVGPIGVQSFWGTIKLTD